MMLLEKFHSTKKLSIYYHRRRHRHHHHRQRVTNFFRIKTQVTITTQSSYDCFYHFVLLISFYHIQRLRWHIRYARRTYINSDFSKNSWLFQQVLLVPGTHVCVYSDTVIRCIAQFLLGNFSTVKINVQNSITISPKTNN